jgi:hypothetical protein
VDVGGRDAEPRRHGSLDITGRDGRVGPREMVRKGLDGVGELILPPSSAAIAETFKSAPSNSRTLPFMCMAM